MSDQLEMTRADIERLLGLLNDELREEGTEGELYLVGGAVMCLALGTRPATRDVDGCNIDGYFRPAHLVRQAARRVAAKADVEPDWLNDAVKAFLSPRGTFDPYRELSNLRVFVAQPEYLLAMKCAAMRLGDEFHDLGDVRFLLRYLNIETAEQAMGIVTRYIDESTLLPKTWLALEELLGG